MTRKTNLLLFVVCIIAVAFTFTLPFIKKDLYTSQNIFDIFTGKRPQLLTPGAILSGEYYGALIGISLAYLALQSIIVAIRDSKITAILSAILGTFGFILILTICLTLQSDGEDRNFSFLSGFYLFIFALITKNIVDWLYLRSTLQKTKSGKTIAPPKPNDQILDS